MSKRENKIQAEILSFLKGNPRRGTGGVGGWWLNVHGGDTYMPRGIPDIIGCYKGRFIALEVKRPGENLKPVQAVTIKHLSSAGAITAVVYDVDDVRRILTEVKRNVHGT